MLAWPVDVRLTDTKRMWQRCEWRIYNTQMNSWPCCLASATHKHIILLYIHTMGVTIYGIHDRMCLPRGQFPEHARCTSRPRPLHNDQSSHSPAFLPLSLYKLFHFSPPWDQDSYPDVMVMDGECQYEGYNAKIRFPPRLQKVTIRTRLLSTPRLWSVPLLKRPLVIICVRSSERRRYSSVAIGRRRHGLVNNGLPNHHHLAEYRGVILPLA